MPHDPNGADDPTQKEEMGSQGKTGEGATQEVLHAHDAADEKVETGEQKLSNTAIESKDSPLWMKISTSLLVAAAVTAMAYGAFLTISEPPRSYQVQDPNRALPPSQNAAQACAALDQEIMYDCLLYVAEMHLMRSHFELGNRSFQLSSHSVRATITSLTMAVVVGSTLILYHLIARTFAPVSTFQFEGGGVRGAMRTMYPGLALAILGTVGLVITRFEFREPAADYEPAYLKGLVYVVDQQAVGDEEGLADTDFEDSPDLDAFCERLGQRGISHPRCENE